MGYNYVYTLEVTRLGGKRNALSKTPSKNTSPAAVEGFEVSTRKNRKIFSFYTFLNVPRTGVIPIPADVKILFKADSADARAEIDLLRKEIGYLREGFKRTQEAATVGNNALARFRGETIALTHVFVSSIDDFGGALTQLIGGFWVSMNVSMHLQVRSIDCRRR